MQIYTHAALGLIVGVAIAPNNGPVQTACVIGSCLPDVAVGPFYIIDRLKDRVPSFANWPRVRILAEAMHSIPLWCIASLIIEWLFTASCLLAFLLGGLSHAMTDSYTHGGRGQNRYTAADNVGFLWPWKFKLGKILGFYEYRDHNFPGLLPKWPEAILSAAIAAIIIWWRIH